MPAQPNDASRTRNGDDFFMRALKSLKGNRVTDNFYVLKGRQDGTILVSEDFRRVYLVLGYLKSIIDLVENVPTRLFRVSLLPYKDLITYDRLLSGVELDTPARKNWKKRAIEAYNNALENNTLITRLNIDTAIVQDLEDDVITKADQKIIEKIGKFANQPVSSNSWFILAPPILNIAMVFCLCQIQILSRICVWTTLRPPHRNCLN